jgi:hypothetical protein
LVEFFSIIKAGYSGGLKISTFHAKNCSLSNLNNQSIVTMIKKNKKTLSTYDDGVITIKVRLNPKKNSISKTTFSINERLCYNDDFGKLSGT